MAESAPGPGVDAQAAIQQQLIWVDRTGKAEYKVAILVAASLFMLETKTKIRVARTMSHVLCTLRAKVGYSEYVDVARNGFHWSLDLREGIDLAIYLGVYERETTRAIRSLLPRGSIALDIGANIGAHTLELARSVGSTGRVIAFEPTVWAVERLRKHVAMNPSIATRVTIEHAKLAAITNANDNTTIYSRWPLYDVGEVHEVHQGKGESTGEARTVTLDDYLAEAAITRVDFIKLDVDGYECDVLDGARSCLASMRPQIIIELAHAGLDERGRSLEELIDQLHTAGYRLFRLSGTPLPTRTSDIVRLINPRGGWNAIARMNHHFND